MNYFLNIVMGKEKIINFFFLQIFIFFMNFYFYFYYVPIMINHLLIGCEKKKKKWHLDLLFFLKLK